jgi:hypothetical protein
LSILALVEEYAIGPLLYLDAKEVVKWIEVLHHELLLKSRMAYLFVLLLLSF